MHTKTSHRFLLLEVSETEKFGLSRMFQFLVLIELSCTGDIHPGKNKNTVFREISKCVPRQRSRCFCSQVTTRQRRLKHHHTVVCWQIFFEFLFKKETKTHFFWNFQTVKYNELQQRKKHIGGQQESLSTCILRILSLKCWRSKGPSVLNLENPSALSLLHHRSGRFLKKIKILGSLIMWNQIWTKYSTAKTKKTTKVLNHVELFIALCTGNNVHRKLFSAFRMQGSSHRYGVPMAMGIKCLAQDRSAHVRIRNLWFQKRAR